MGLIQKNIRRLMKEKGKAAQGKPFTQDDIVFRSRIVAERKALEGDEKPNRWKISTSTIKTVLRENWDGQQSTIDAFAAALGAEPWEITTPYELQKAIKEYPELRAEHNKNQELLKRLG